LRKAGHTLERLDRKTGPDAYHLVGKPGGADTPATGSDGTAGDE
jgi:hypothetical protein